MNKKLQAFLAIFVALMTFACLGSGASPTSVPVNATEEALCYP